MRVVVVVIARPPLSVASRARRNMAVVLPPPPTMATASSRLMPSADVSECDRPSRAVPMGGIVLRLRLMWQLVAAIVFMVLAAPQAHAGPSGTALSGLDPYDEVMVGLLRKWKVAGGSLAVARHGKLVLVRGYGLANRERGVPVEPSSVFRLASLSKTVTAVAVLQLVQEGRLGLDDKVLPILGDLGPRPGRITDGRVHDITVRHLLQHSGGWSRGRSGDVVFMPGSADAAKRQRGPLPPDCPTVLRDTLERRLDFTPGERFAYSNVGYCMLGRVIERVTGTGYEAHVRTRVLAPVGAAGMKIGRTLDAAPGEVTYYDFESKTVRAVPGLGPKVAPRPYGEFAIETMDAFGGWIGTPVDYLRFILAIDGRRGPPLLNLATLGQMNAPSGLPTESAATDDLSAKGTEYALGTYVRQRQDGSVNLWHTGSVPGTSAIAVRAGDGYAWVAVFNGRPENRYAWRAEIERGLWAARGTVRKWPDGDLFR